VKPSTASVERPVNGAQQARPARVLPGSRIIAHIAGVRVIADRRQEHRDCPRQPELRTAACEPPHELRPAPNNTHRRQHPARSRSPAADIAMPLVAFQRRRVLLRVIRASPPRPPRSPHRPRSRSQHQANTSACDRTPSAANAAKVDRSSETGTAANGIRCLLPALRNRNTTKSPQHTRCTCDPDFLERLLTNAPTVSPRVDHPPPRLRKNSAITCAPRSTSTRLARREENPK